jgi:predicted GIY-YIG superfamily endonuclease
MPAFVYILCCADGSYYVGSSRGELLDKRLGEHQAGTYAGYPAGGGRSRSSGRNRSSVSMRQSLTSAG